MTTLNALLAADGIIVPVGMSQLDVASMGEFFRFCAYILDALAPRITPQYLLQFDFMKLVVSRFDPQQVGQEQCRAWLLTEMPDFVLQEPILQTAALGHAHAGWETLYEYRPDSNRAAAYQRGLTSIDQVCYGLECAIWSAWGREDAPPALGTDGEPG
jgi:chromosome partitioning protein